MPLLGMCETETGRMRCYYVLSYLLKNTTFQLFGYHGLYVCKRLTSPGLGVLRGKYVLLIDIVFVFAVFWWGFTKVFKHKQYENG